MKLPEIKWTGDLDDDCVAEVAGYVLHCEALDDNDWYVGVYEGKGKESVEIFHTDSHDVRALTGKAARMLAEIAMIADFVRKRHRQNSTNPLARR